MPFLLAEILNFQGSTHHIGVGSFSNLYSNFNYGVMKFNQLSASDTQHQCVFGYIVESSVLSRFFYEVLP